jgi:hypothetical protein
MITGNWKNNISKETYLEHYRHIDALGHPTSSAQIDELNKISVKGDSNAVKRKDQQR